MKIKTCILMLALVLSALIFTACPDEKKTEIVGKSGNPTGTPVKGAPTSQMHPDIERKYQDLARAGGWAQVRETSPDGVIVYSVVPIPDEALPPIEQAVKIRIEVIKKKFPFWTKGLRLNEHHIHMIEPDGITSESKLPFLRLGGVQTAGTIAWGDFAFVVIPHFEGVGWSKPNDLRDYVYNEDEHLTEYLNRFLDPVNRYNEFLGFGDQHPHDAEFYEFLPRGLRAGGRKQSKQACRHLFEAGQGIVVTKEVRTD